MLDEYKRDFCIISKEDVVEQIEIVDRLIETIEQYISSVVKQN